MPTDEDYLRMAREALAKRPYTEPEPKRQRPEPPPADIDFGAAEATRRFQRVQTAAITSLVCGGMSVFLGCLLPIPVVGMMTGAYAILNRDALKPGSWAMAISGLCLSGLFLLVGVYMMIQYMPRMR